MRLRTPLTVVASAAGLVVALTACAPDPSSDTPSAEPAASSPSVDKTLLNTRVADYQQYLVDESKAMIKATTAFTDAVRAGDVAKAKSLFAASRYHWETIEPLAGLVASVDGRVDSRVDDFASVDDPRFIGWHRLEYMLWVEGKLTPLSSKYATLLDQDLAPLPSLLAQVDMDANDVSIGAAGLIEEVSEGKITGEEDRYSHTDLYDLAANVNGSLRAFQVYEPVLLGVDRPLELKIEQTFLDAKGLLATYQKPDGTYGSYLDFTKADRLKLQAMLAGLSENLSSVSGALGL